MAAGGDIHVRRNGSWEPVYCPDRMSVEDLAVSTDGHQLFALAPRSLQIVSFTVSHDGSLTAVGSGSGLPAGSAGLAAN